MNDQGALVFWPPLLCPTRPAAKISLSSLSGLLRGVGWVVDRSRSRYGMAWRGLQPANRRGDIPEQDELA
jgi:hypothetical protein